MTSHTVIPIWFCSLVAVAASAEAAVRTACPAYIDGFRCDDTRPDRLSWSIQGGRQPADQGVVEFFRVSRNQSAALRARCYDVQRENSDGWRWRGYRWTCFQQVLDGQLFTVTARAGERSVRRVERLLATQPWLDEPLSKDGWTLAPDERREAVEQCDEGFLALAQLERHEARAAFHRALFHAPRAQPLCARVGLAATDVLTAALHRRMGHRFGEQAERAQRHLEELIREAAWADEAEEAPPSDAAASTERLLLYAVQAAFENLEETALRAPGESHRPPLGPTALVDALADGRAPLCGRQGTAAALEARCVTHWMTVTFAALAERGHEPLDAAEARWYLHGCGAGHDADPRQGLFRATRVCAAWVDATLAPDAFRPGDHQLMPPRGRLGRHRDGWLAPIGAMMLGANRRRTARHLVYSGPEHPLDPLDRYVYVESHRPPRIDDQVQGSTPDPVHEDGVKRALPACGDLGVHWWRLDESCAALYDAATHFAAAGDTSRGGFLRVLTGMRNRRDALARALDDLGYWPSRKMDATLQRSRVTLTVQLAWTERWLAEQCEGQKTPRCEREPLPICGMLRRARTQVTDLAYDLRTAWREELRLNCGT